MSRPAVTTTPPSPPSLVDYFLLLTGCGLSVFLARIPLLAEPEPVDTRLAHYLLPVLPLLLRLPDGVILLWPLFYLGQRLLGRAQGLTAVEWLWTFAWLGLTVLTGLAALNQNARLPGSLPDVLAYWPPVIWYVILVPSMALLAIVLTVLGLFARTTPPWTHSLAVVLVVWPLLPLAGILILGKFS